jgi:hypothetical protein
LKIEKTDSPHYFICSHVKRDDRCGYCGPRIFDKIVEELKKKKNVDIELRVRKIAHTGGHAFAANVLVFPTGDW